jgi:hypothetical protein
MLISFLINIAACFAFVILGYISNITYQWFKLSSFRTIWKPFLRDKSVTVVLSTRPGPLKRSTPRVSFDEMQAYADINKTLTKINISTIPVSSEIALEEIREKNLVILGGPIANKVTANFWPIISKQLPFYFDLEKQIILAGQREYSPQLNENNILTKDYGIIMRVPNPLSNDKYIVLAMGCHGFSTHGLINMMVKIESAKEIINATNNKDFAALVEFILQDNMLISENILECYIPVKT